MSDEVARAVGIDPTRVAGPDRYETAVALSRQLFPNGADGVYIATGERYADALSAAGALSIGTNALLLTRKGELPASVAEELQRLAPERVLVLGGSAVVSDAVLEAIRLATGVVPSRLAGADRYETSVAVSRAAHPAGASSAYLATGTSYADALAVSPALSDGDAALLLTRREELPDAVANELERLEPSAVFVLGGTAAVSDYVLDEIAGIIGAAPTRLAGDDRYATAVVVSRHAAPEGAPDLFVATGSEFADALTASQALTRGGAALVLAESTSVPESSDQELLRLATGDFDPPALASSAATPSEVEAGDEVTFTWQLTDDAGVGRVSATVASPSGNAFSTCFDVEVPLADGTPQDGTYRLTCVVPLATEPGTFVLFVTAADAAGNITTIEGASLVVGNGALLETRVTPSTVAPGESVTVEWHLQDEDGITSTYAMLTSPADGSVTGCGGAGRATGTNFDGWWTQTCALPRSALLGTYRVTVRAQSPNGELGMPDVAATFQVAGSAVTPDPVTGDAQLVSAAVAPSTVDPGQSVQVSWRLRSPAGITLTNAWLYNPTGGPGPSCAFPAGRSSGSEFDGTWTQTCALPSGATPGTYRVRVQASDANGLLDLRNMATSFVVNGALPPGSEQLTLGTVTATPDPVSPGGVVTISWTVTDPSGVGQTFAYVDTPSGSSVSTCTTYSDASGTNFHRCTIPSTGAVGTYSVEIQARSTSGYERWWSPALTFTVA